MTTVMERTTQVYMQDTTLDARLVLLEQAFIARFGSLGPDFALAYAPGRIEWFGNYTDNVKKGRTLSANINRNLLFLGRPRSDGIVRIASLNKDGEVIQFPIGSATELFAQRDGSWVDYIRAVLWSFEISGWPLTGFDAIIESTIPLGAGVSSSAAIELATAVWLAHATGTEIPPIGFVEAAKLAENKYVGVPSGFLDQGTSMLADGGALRIDYVERGGRPFQWKDVQANLSRKGYMLMVGFDPLFERQLTGGEYARRSQAFAEGLTLLQGIYNPSLQTLADVPYGVLDSLASPLTEGLGPVALDYIRHVVMDNYRVDRAEQALYHDDLSTLGQVMIDSGRSSISLLGLHENCHELYALLLYLERYGKAMDVTGFRNMGGGFAPTLLLLLPNTAAPRVRETLATYYQRFSGHRYEWITSLPAPAAGLLDFDALMA